MNKIYKVIWSKAKNCYVVVSELAKRNGKCKTAKTDDSNGRNRLTNLLSFNTPALTKAVMAMLVAGMIAMPAISEAADVENVTYDTKSPFNIVGGADAKPGSNNVANSIILGRKSEANKNQTIAIGSGTNSSTGAQAVNYGSIAIGSWASYNSTSYNAAKASGNLSIAFGSGAYTKNDFAIAVGTYAQATAQNAIAVGSSSAASVQDAIAVGRSSAASAQDAIAVGRSSAASVQDAIAVGSSSAASAQYAIAVGSSSAASVQDAIAVGRGANASAMDAIAVGRGAKATVKEAITLGRGALSRGEGSISLGAGSRVRTDYTIAIGYNAGIARMNLKDLPEEGGKGSGNAIAIGSNSGNFTYGYYDSVDYESYAHIKNSIAIGYKAHTHAANAFAIGVSTDATAERSFAIGTSSTSYVKIDKNTGNINDAHLGSSARGQGSITFGDTALVLAEDPRTGGDYERATDTDVNDAIAVGTNSLSQARNAVALGGGISYTYHEGTGNTMTNITKYYDNSKEDPWVDRAEGTGAQIGLKSDGAVAIGGATADVTGINDRTYPTTEANKLKVDNYTPAATVGANAKRAIAIGSGALIGNDAENSVAVGARNEVTGKNSTAVGIENNVTGDNSIAIGTSQTVTGNNSGAFGDPSTVSGDNSYSFGNGNEIKANDAFVVGNQAKVDVNANYSAAIGYKANAKTSDSVALGSESVAKREKGKDASGNTSSGWDPLTGKASTNTNATWRSTRAAVSVGDNVGDNNITRQIINVAAGSDDTDAVNVAQLKRAATHYYSVNADDSAAPPGTNYMNDGAKNAGALASGQKAFAYGINSVAVGHGAIAGTTDGKETPTYSGNYSVAIGSGSTASLTNSVALGSNSTTKEGEIVPEAIINKITFGNFNGSLSDKNRVVSVGSEGATRQIQNVAAGRISATSTDAVNGSQLYAVADQLQWKIGIGKDGSGTNVVDSVLKTQSTVGKLTPTVDKSNVKIVAGDGIDVSDYAIDAGYGIKVSSHVIDVVGEQDAEGFLLKGVKTSHGTYLTRDEVANAVNNMVTDKRAIYASLLPDGTGFKIDMISPFLHVNNSSLLDDDGNLNARFFSEALGADSLALGINSEADGKNSIAIGHNADATGKADGIKADAAIAVGYNTHAHGPGSVSIGVASTTSGNRAIAVGTTARYVDDTDYTTDNAHQGARAAGQGAIALGDQARILGSEYHADDSKIGLPDYTTNDSIAIGTKTEVKAKNAIAVGGNTSYTYFDEATEKSMTVYGTTSNVAGGDSQGAKVGVGADSGIAIGGAYGTFDPDKKEIQQEMNAASVFGLRGIAIGSGSMVADPKEYKRLTNQLNDADYIQKKNAFQEARSNYFEALADYQSYMDKDPNDPLIPEEMRQNWETLKTNAYNALYGEGGTPENPGTYVEDGEVKDSATKIMYAATAAYSLALKKVVRTQVDESVTDTDAIAIGTQAIAGVQDSIALGSKAATDENDLAGQLTGMSGYDPLSTTSDNDYFRGDSKYAEDDPVWRSTAGSLSLGGTWTNEDNSTTRITRRISNVAAGIDDADAVNIAQLKRATTITSGNRVVTIGVKDKGEKIVYSPFIHTNGISEAAQYIDLVIEYNDEDGYKNGLQSQVDEIEGRIQSINTTKAIIDGKIAGLQQQVDAGEITQAEADAEKAEYDTQLFAIEERLIKLNSDKNTIKQKIDSEEYKTEFKKAQDYYNDQSMAYGKDSVAIGRGAVVGDLKDTTKGNASLAIGTDVTVTGNNSIGIGTGHKIYGNNSGAFGDPTEIDASVEGSYAIGNNSHIATSDTFILGNSVTTTYQNSVFLGSHSGYTPANDKSKSTAGVDGYGTKDEPVKINGTGYEFAGATPDGVVSVGYQGEIDGESVTITRRIQNVSAGLISAESTDAINGSQLYAAMQALSVQIIGDTDPNTKSTNVIKTPAATGEGGTGTGEGTGTEIKLNPTTFEVKASTTTVELGTDTQKSNNLILKELNQEEGKETDPKSYRYQLDLNKDLTVDSVKAGDTTINNDGMTVGDTSITKDEVKTKTFNAGNTTMTNDGISIAGGSSPVNLTNSGLNVGDTTVNNSGVTIQNGPSMTAADGFKYGDSTLNDTGLTVGNATVQDNKIAIDGGPSMTKEGVNAGGQKITNVADGDISANSTDAVSGSQLYSAIDNVNHDITNLGNQISNVDNRARKGIAGAAALAALHPMEFDPDDKLTFAAGMGHYRGETAAALGMFYRPDEKVMFSLGGTVGNGENMVNAGVSFSLDRTPRVTGSRTALTKEVVHLREQVARQDAQIAKQDQQIAMQGAQIAQLTALVSQLTGAKVDLPALPEIKAPTPFPDNLDNKWAYDKLEELEQQGYIKGYAGRSLSRDEFAAALDRALAGGATLDERLVKEFMPELSHVRVAHVEGKGNEEGEWYERPRFSHDKLEKHDIDKKQIRVPVKQQQQQSKK